MGGNGGRRYSRVAGLGAMLHPTAMLHPPAMLHAAAHAAPLHPASAPGFWLWFHLHAAVSSAGAEPAAAELSPHTTTHRDDGELPAAITQLTLGALGKR